MHRHDCGLTGRARQVAAVLAVAFLLSAPGGAQAATAAQSEQPDPTDPVVVVESFLAARDASDPRGATGWCAELLELQDIDGSWFVDSAATSDWLRQLTERYVLERLVPLHVQASVVTWTERLTPRSIPFPDAPRSSIILEVHAVVRDGKIVYLSAPYPPLPLRLPGTAWNDGSRGRQSVGAASVSPATLFMGTALGLVLTAVVAAGCARVLSAGRRSRGEAGALEQSVIGARAVGARRVLSRALRPRRGQRSRPMEPTIVCLVDPVQTA